VVIDELRAKLKARKGRPGFQANVAALEQAIAVHENAGPFRDKDTGRFVSREYALANPDKVEIA
jgi:hypothetical protein